MDEEEQRQTEETLLHERKVKMVIAGENPGAPRLL